MSCMHTYLHFPRKNWISCHTQRLSHYRALSLVCSNHANHTEQLDPLFSAYPLISFMAFKYYMGACDRFYGADLRLFLNAAAEKENLSHVAIFYLVVWGMGALLLDVSHALDAPPVEC